MGKNMGKLVYLSYYSTERVCRRVSPVTITMTKYISNVLNNSNGPITIISPIQSNEERYYPREKEVKGQNIVMLMTLIKQKKFNSFCFIIEIMLLNSMFEVYYFSYKCDTVFWIMAGILSANVYNTKDGEKN